MCIKLVMDIVNYSGILHRSCVMDQNQTSGPIGHIATDQSEHQSEHGSDIGMQQL